MFFYSESIELILRKQNLSGYIESVIVSDKSQRKVMPTPKLVQLVSSNCLSDGLFNFPCAFTGLSFKIGSYLRMTQWEINTNTCQLIVHDAQYLGGSGCEVQHGKKWDNDKLRTLASSRILSKYFVILHEPTPDITDKDIPEFTYNSLSRALSKKNVQEDQQKENFEKKRANFKEQDTSERRKEQVIANEEIA